MFQDILVEKFWRPRVLGAGERRSEAQRRGRAPQGPSSQRPGPATLPQRLLATLPCGRGRTACARMPAPRGRGVSWAPLDTQRVTGVCWGLNPEGGMRSTPPAPCSVPRGRCHAWGAAGTAGLSGHFWAHVHGLCRRSSAYNLSQKCLFTEVPNDSC